MWGRHEDCLLQVPRDNWGKYESMEVVEGTKELSTVKPRFCLVLCEVGHDTESTFLFGQPTTTISREMWRQIHGWVATQVWSHKYTVIMVVNTNNRRNIAKQSKLRQESLSLKIIYICISTPGLQQRLMSTRLLYNGVMHEAVR